MGVVRDLLSMLFYNVDLRHGPYEIYIRKAILVMFPITKHFLSAFRVSSKLLVIQWEKF